MEIGIVFGYGYLPTLHWLQGVDIFVLAISLKKHSLNLSNPQIVVPKRKKVCLLSLALNYLAISSVLAGLQNAPDQRALVGNYVVSADFRGPVSPFHFENE